MVFLVALCYFIATSSRFQNWAAQKAVTYLSEEFKTKVKLKAIKFEFINNLVLEGLYIEDRHGDTLAYFGKLKTNFNYRFLFDNTLQLARLNKVEIEDTKLNMVIYPNEKRYNYEFLVDYFSSPSVSGKPYVAFKLFIDQVKLKNVDFRLQDKNYSKAVGRKFDESCMVFKGIHSHIAPFKLVDDSLNLNILKLSFIEKSGFEVKEFSSKMIISRTKLEFGDLNLITPHSHLKEYLKFSYNGYGQLSNFIDSVKWKVNLNNSLVSMKDISYFSDELLPYQFPIKINGKVTGTLAKLRGRKMDITVGKLNHFKGDVNLKDLVNPAKMSFNFEISELIANPSSIQNLTRTQFPEELLRIGSLRYVGQLNGAIKDFTATGLIETTIGNIRTNLNLKFPEGKPEEYQGEIELFSFDIAKLLNNGNFGLSSLFIKVDGQGFTMQDLNTKLQGTVQAFGYDGYTYSNATFDGVLDKKIFNGKFAIQDPNVNLSFNGLVDMNNENPGGDFTANVEVINLEKLGYGNINIKGIKTVNLKFAGKDIDDMKIDASLSNVVLSKKDSIYYLGQIDLNADGSYSNRSVELKSVLGNFTLKGQYKFSQINAIVSNLLFNLFPDYYAYLKTDTEPVNFRYDLEINDSRFLSELVLPELRFAKLTTTGVYNSTSQTLDIIARADYLNYGNFKFKEVDIECVKQQNQRLSLSTLANEVLINDSLFTDRLRLKADVGGNDINFSLNTSDITKNASLVSSGTVEFSKGAIDLRLKNSTFYIYNKPWRIDQSNHFRYSNSKIKIDSFFITNGDQSVSVNGLSSAQSFENLSLSIRNFNLKEISPLLVANSIDLGGEVNGDLTFNGSINRPIIESNLTIDNFVYNTDSVGDVELFSKSTGSQNKMEIKGSIKNGLIHDMALLGSIDLTPDKDNIHMDCSLKESNIKPFEMFTEGLFSNVTGKANGIISINGPLSNPKIEGKIVLKNVGLYMDYLGLPLNIDVATIKIDEKKIDLGNFQVKDKYGYVALAGGKIFHKNFDNLRFDIFMKDLKNFNCMELNEDQGDMFFGTAYVDGDMKVTGTLDDLYLNINAKTRAKTSISLPLTSSTENMGPDFIKIMDLRADIVSSQVKKLSGIAMDFNFDVTSDAEVKLIFDAKFNDVMSATGNGNIKMELNTFGDFYMYGSYVIDKGGYNFTALNNLVNAKLKVKSGSKITWEGSPYDAKLDVIAITTIKADPTVILPLTSTGKTSNNVAIDCEIHMKEDLFKPEIQLGIDLSKDNQSVLFANADLNNAINQIRGDQEESNKQFINLLVFSSFAPINSANTATGIDVANSFENSIGAFVSNQVNNWLRQINPNWELDVDWKSATNKEVNQQIIVSLKRKLYNDRIEIGGTYGQAGNTSYDVNLSYKIKKDGKLRVRGFNNRANDPININNKPINTSGVGLYYRKEFDYFFPKKWRKKIWDKQHPNAVKT